jgi:hypothetical protein
MSSDENRLKTRLEQERRRILTRPRVCMYPGCSSPAIGSHVLQSSTMLKSIADRSNHFYTMGGVSLFEMAEGNLFTIRKVGIKAGYKFLGFCNHHDHTLFRDIETHPIDLYNRRSQLLFVYRTICLELRKQQMYIETNHGIIDTMRELEPHKVHAAIMKPALLAIKDLEFFKKEIEDEVLAGGVCDFMVETIRLPKHEICFSASVTIEDRDNPNTKDVDDYGFPKDTPLAVSVLNYFPYVNASYFVVGSHRKIFCNWTTNLIKELQRGDKVDKILSDILTYRLEFWGMSPAFYEQLPAETRKRFIEESHRHVDDFSFEIRSDFNLFE